LGVSKTFDDQRMEVFKAKFEEFNDVKLFEDNRSDIINYSRYSRSRIHSSRTSCVASSSTFE